MKSFAALAVAAWLGAAPWAQAPALPAGPLEPLVAKTEPARSCDSLLSVSLPDTTIDAAAIDETDPAGASCRITATVTHPPVGDKVKIFLAFPLKKWNGLDDTLHEHCFVPCLQRAGGLEAAVRVVRNLRPQL